MLHPYFTYQMALQRVASFQQEAENYRRVREAKAYRRARAASLHPPQPVRTAIQLRLSACRDEHCRVAFYDKSRNRSRAWCSMEVCGNREKARSFRARHHSHSAR